MLNSFMLKIFLSSDTKVLLDYLRDSILFPKGILLTAKLYAVRSQVWRQPVSGSQNNSSPWSFHKLFCSSVLASSLRLSLAWSHLLPLSPHCTLASFQCMRQPRWTSLWEFCARCFLFLEVSPRSSPDKLLVLQA